MKNVIKDVITEARIFFSIPAIVHLCILGLIIKQLKHSMKATNYFNKYNKRKQNVWNRIKKTQG